MKNHSASSRGRQAPQFINPHRLFHGVWLPEWLEERPEVSEKAKKLYAYLTYFAGGKGYAWPSFNHLAQKLHISRRYVIKLVQELSAHGLITATNVSNPAKGHCTNHYRFLWHPWMQTAEDGDFRMAVREEQAPFPTTDSDLSFTPPSEPHIATPGEQEFTSPSELEDTSPGEPQITPLVIPSSPKENNKKRINIRGKVPATSSGTSSSKVHSTAAPPPKILSDTTKIILERRVAELRTEIATASKRGNHDRAEQLHAELVEHQTKLGFTPDDPPPKLKASREEEFGEPATLSDWPSPEEVRAAFNEVRHSMGWPIKR
jgi:Helix-turn-helix domain